MKMKKNRRKSYYLHAYILTNKQTSKKINKQFRYQRNINSDSDFLYFFLLLINLSGGQNRKIMAVFQVFPLIGKKPRNKKIPFNCRETLNNHYHYKHE